jgi:hypothetical protein
MQLDAMTSRAQILESLTRSAEAAWGAPRLAALEPTLDAVATALWELAQQPLGPLDVEPDFISGAEG